jgi:hypothetical protein
MKKIMSLSIVSILTAAVISGCAGSPNREPQQVVGNVGDKKIDSLSSHNSSKKSAEYICGVGLKFSKFNIETMNTIGGAILYNPIVELKYSGELKWINVINDEIVHSKKYPAKKNKFRISISKTMSENPSSPLSKNFNELMAIQDRFKNYIDSGANDLNLVTCLSVYKDSQLSGRGVTIIEALKNIQFVSSK